MTSKNPLLSVIRQPKLFLNLPSQGKFWAENSLEITETSEHAVYAMTARDELLLKTPDALLNGQAVVNVIQNCIPTIKDAWQTPQIDLDAILIAIRIATYGEFMDCDIKHLGQEATYSIDLNQVLVNIHNNFAWEERINVDDTFIVYIKPLNYLQISKNSAESLETQKILNLVNDETINENEKLDKFRESFLKLSDLNLSNVYNSIWRIDIESESVTNRQHIKEFVEQCDRKIFNVIKTHLDKQITNNTIKPFKVRATPEMIAAGSQEEIDMPVVFDPSSFFG